MGTVRKNVIANYVGQGWTALMGLAFLPVYVKYLGVEAYGLIGMFALLQAWLGLLDMGLTPTLSREMARYTGGARDAQSIRDLLRSIEIIAVAIAMIIALGIWAASGWLAADWLRVEKLPVGVVARAFAVMGIVTSLRFIENIYRSGIVGLQQQVALNVAVTTMATLRSVGAVGVLIWISPTIEAFFVWQGIVSAVTVGLLASVLYRALPAATNPVRFSRAALREIKAFALGMLGIAFLSLLSTQMDKIVLSRLLPLKTFGYYAFASAVANALYVLPSPVTAAFSPHLAELVALGDREALVRAYHKAAQLVTVLMGTAAIVLIVFGDAVIVLWTRNPGLSRNIVALVAVLSLGALLNGLMWVPYQMQLAHGWTTLSISMSVVGVVVGVPAILWATPRYGAMGAAWISVVLNVGYGTIAMRLFHRRLLPTEMWRWYRQDLALPLIAGAIVGVAIRQAAPSFRGTFAQLIVLLFSAGLVLAATALAAPEIREGLAVYLPKRLKPTHVRPV